jgi:hypothetical protein
MSTKILTFSLLFALAGALPAQTSSEIVSLLIPDVALLAVRPDDGPITLNITVSPIAVSADFITDSDDSRFLNYSSAVESGASSRAIYAELSSGSLPSGLLLQIELGTPSGAAEGQLAVPVGPVTITSTPQSVATSIRGARTGIGSGNGHQLFYSILVDDAEELGENQGTNPLVITYTLADD